MKTIETIEQYNEVIQNGKVIMMFTADWCPDCQVLKPVLPEIEAEFSDYQFYAVDRDRLLDLFTEHNVFGIPSFIAYENGKELGRFVSKDRKTKEEIAEFIRGL
ncbi:thioredoxin [Thermolongibacillus altinsuensis]|jgi:thiol-disulfide isomerase/thioredoxin|uniref:Thioredoxin n=1 Tax=Thermolongibacillus altinsuensis TaxID=575256 RepID=A0A4V2QAG0_9BACL|nr:thioredoxin family protein [Thermolongibacillus altinsuensis]TCL51775.1 thioredoxin [Thermolongibacillus altinsuensis]GMB07300.1 thiol reductase thioredoxin [Thermolongibacillus altinsuensis]